MGKSTCAYATFFALLWTVFIAVSFLLMFQSRFSPRATRTFHIMRTYVTNEGEEVTYGYNPFIATLIAFIVGFVGGFFGIGGGSLMVPAMILLFLFPPHVAVATSMFIVFLSSIVSSLTHVFIGNVAWTFAFALIPGVWVGAKCGAWLNRRLKGKTVMTLLRIVLILLGVRLIVQGLGW